jgi:hypothetical protein
MIEMAQKKYVRVSQGVNKYTLVPEDQVESQIKSNEEDYYTSLYTYNESHYNTWKSSKSVAGIRDVVTNRIFFDFDKKDDVEAARKDAVTLVDRLVKDGINPTNIQICFSGSKGFSIEVLSTNYLNPQQFKNLVFSYASDLKTFDQVVNDPNRLIRVVGTKHKESGLYKFPLKADQLKFLKVEEILNLAKDLDNADESLTQGWIPVALPKEVHERAFKDTRPEKPKVEMNLAVIDSIKDLPWYTKPKWLTNCKFSIMNGFVPQGQRNNALMALAATLKAQGFSKEHTLASLKTTTEKMASLTGEDIFPEDELKKNVIEYVYGPSWKGGAYTCREEGWLKNYCDSLGHHKCQHTQVLGDSPRTIIDVSPKFKEFVMNIEQNTIKTGVPSLDENLFITTGMGLGLVGAPGSGKSSLALEILNNTSKQGIPSVFASLDMTATRIYEKLAYRLTGQSRKQLYEMFRQNKEEKYLETLQEEFGNVFFYDKSSPTVREIRDYIVACEQESGKKIKLVVIDYFERVFSDVSDDTAASKRVAAEIQDLINDLGVCVIVLLQPNKMSGDLSDPITSYLSIKGSSFIQQSLRMILSVYREGFDPRHPQDDRYLTINVLKNDLGETNSFDFLWEGKRGKIYEASPEDLDDLDAIRKRRKQEDSEGW